MEGRKKHRVELRSRAKKRSTSDFRSNNYKVKHSLLNSIWHPFALYTKKSPLSFVL